MLLKTSHFLYVNYIPDIMSRRGIPLAAMQRIIEQAGADRVSEDAKRELRAVCIELVNKIGAKAIKYAEHTGRKTLKEEDISLAARNN